MRYYLDAKIVSIYSIFAAIAAILLMPQLGDYTKFSFFLYIGLLLFGLIVFISLYKESDKEWPFMLILLVIYGVGEILAVITLFIDNPNKYILFILYEVIIITPFIFSVLYVVHKLKKTPLKLKSEENIGLPLDSYRWEPEPGANHEVHKQRLEKLRQSGLISEDEYERRRKLLDDEPNR